MLEHRKCDCMRKTKSQTILFFARHDVICVTVYPHAKTKSICCDCGNRNTKFCNIIRKQY